MYSGTAPREVGKADNAPTHVARSSAGNRCTVPRGPNVFTSVRSSQSAR